jgi:hypothetical protein
MPIVVMNTHFCRPPIGETGKVEVGNLSTLVRFSPTPSQ